MYTISGWLSAVVGLISLVLFLPGIFSEHDVAVLEAQRLQNTQNNSHDELPRPDLLAVFACVSSFFMFLFNFILLETIGTPMCMEQLGWDEKTSITNLGILMSVGAVISMIAYGTVPVLTNKFDERWVYIVLGLIPMTIGRVIMLPMGTELPKRKPPTFHSQDGMSKYADLISKMYNVRDAGSCEDQAAEPGCDLDWCEWTPAITEIQFYIGYIIAAISFPYCMAICQAMFSKVIGPRPQGLWMGLLTAVGSLARICGPIFVSFIYVNYGTYWTFGLCTATLVFSTLVTVITFKRLVPIDLVRESDHTAVSYNGKDEVEGVLDSGHSHPENDAVKSDGDNEFKSVIDE